MMQETTIKPGDKFTGVGKVVALGNVLDAQRMEAIFDRNGHRPA